MRCYPFSQSAHVVTDFLLVKAWVEVSSGLNAGRLMCFGLLKFFSLFASLGKIKRAEIGTLSKTSVVMFIYCSTKLGRCFVQRVRTKILECLEN